MAGVRDDANIKEDGVMMPCCVYSRPFFCFAEVKQLPEHEMSGN